MSVNNCPELFHPNRPIRRVNFDNYDRLHYEGQKLIRSWFQRAWGGWGKDKEEVFEPFIFLWFSVNSWAACVTDTDRDAELIDALAADPRLNKDFDSFISNQNSEVAVNAKSFADLLPIFDVKTLKRQHIPLRYDNGESRAERVEYYLNQGALVFEPKCWKRHIDSGEGVPLDWAHILRAIYKVRCNLFHGQKSAHSEMDKRIVSAAFLTLVHFVGNARYI